MTRTQQQFFADVFIALLFLGAIWGWVAVGLHEQARKREAREVPDAGVQLGAVRVCDKGEGLEALPPRGEVLFFDRHGRTRAKLLDGTWPVRLLVIPVRGEPVLVTVDELGNAGLNAAPAVLDSAP